MIFFRRFDNFCIGFNFKEEIGVCQVDFYLRGGSGWNGEGSEFLEFGEWSCLGIGLGKYNVVWRRVVVLVVQVIWVILVLVGYGEVQV